MPFSAKTDTGDVGTQADTNVKHASDDFARHVSFWLPT